MRKYREIDLDHLLKISVINKKIHITNRHRFFLFSFNSITLRLQFPGSPFEMNTQAELVGQKRTKETLEKREQQETIRTVLTEKFERFFLIVV